MSDESADSDAKSSKKKTSKSKGSKSSKNKSAGSQSAEPQSSELRSPESPEPQSPELPLFEEVPQPDLSSQPNLASDLQESVARPDTARHPSGLPNEPVADESTIDDSTIEESTVGEPIVPKDDLIEPVVTEPGVSERDLGQPGEPVASEPVASEPASQSAALSWSAARTGGAVGGGTVDSGPDVVPPGWPEPAPRFVISNVVTIILGVVAVGLAVGLILTMLSLSNKSDLESARTGALSAARTYSIELSSYNYKQLNKDFATVESHSTPSFKKTFSQSSDALKATLIKFKASSKATILASAVVTATTSRVVALIFLSQTVSNSTQKAPATDRSQIQMTLLNSGGKWLIDVVTLL